MRSSIKSIKVPSITPYEKILIQRRWSDLPNDSVIASLFCACAREAGYGDLLFFDTENVYFEDYAGVSPQWLAVRVRVQGGLIPDYGDSFLCYWVPL